MSGQLSVVSCGLVPYEEARRAQRALAAARAAGEIGDLLLLLEHPPVYTRGRRSAPGELPMGEDWYRAQGIEVCDTDRGGRVTYHGPGQLVGYPIVSLKEFGNRAARIDVVAYVRRLERAMIETLDAAAVAAQTIAGLTGVWTRGAPPGDATAEAEAHKIGSIGVHVSRGVTTHGLAVNVNNDLQPFEWIVPCGIEGARMTSVSRELGAEQDLSSFAELLTERFAAIHDREALTVEPRDLAERVPGTEVLAGNTGALIGAMAADPGALAAASPADPEAALP